LLVNTGGRGKGGPRIPKNADHIFFAHQFLPFLRRYLSFRVDFRRFLLKSIDLAKKNRNPTGIEPLRRS